ncbi:MAG TPA: hypothetical protein VFS40_05265 [Gemmatimonadales bacterium]|nr:hypothetical protein [Gemmatimonadales bacterium]
MIRRAALVALLLAGAAGAACSRTPERPVPPSSRPPASPPPIADVLRRHTDRLMALPGVVGVGEGARDGRPTVHVMVVRRTPELERALPDSLEGYAVEVVETGVIRAQDS